MTEPTFCSGLADIASRYRGLIVDQWGVLHDGVSAYPEALACLAELRKAGKRIVLLSNSGKRTRINVGRLREMSITDDLYDAVVTSGEAAWRALAERSDPFFANLGRRCVMWSRYGDRSLLDDLPLEVVSDPDDADFLLLGGVEDGSRLEQFVDTLERAAARGLPMVCANPDVIALGPDGLGMGPGAVATHYESLGGKVAYLGKPHRPIYARCLEALCDLEPDEILAVGDSVQHDVAGAAGVGLDAALVMGGIHAPQFDLERGASANRAVLDQLSQKYGATPRWVLPRFRWRG